MKERGQDIFGKIEGWDAARLQASKWFVVGAGALGNEVLKNLALLGVGEIWIMDFDRVEAGNLSRSVLFDAENAQKNELKVTAAAASLRKLNPEVKVRILAGDVMSDVGLGLLRRMDVVMGCVDNRLARMMLNRHCFRLGIPWINGGTEQLTGEVNWFSHEGACYECRLADLGRQEIRRRLGCPDIARRYAARGRAVTTPVAAAVAGAIMVSEGLNRLFGNHNRPQNRWRLRFELQKALFREGEMTPPGENCDSHFQFPEIIEIPELSVRMNIRESLEILKKRFGTEVKVELPVAVATGVADLKSGGITPVLAPVNHLPERVGEMAEMAQSAQPAIPPGHLIDRIDKTFAPAKATWQELGLPPLQIVKMLAGEARYYIEFSGDLDFYSSAQPEIRIPTFLFQSSD